MEILIPIDMHSQTGEIVTAKLYSHPISDAPHIMFELNGIAYNMPLFAVLPLIATFSEANKVQNRGIAPLYELSDEDTLNALHNNP